MVKDGVGGVHDGQVDAFGYSVLLGRVRDGGGMLYVLFSVNMVGIIGYTFFCVFCFE